MLKRKAELYVASLFCDILLVKILVHPSDADVKLSHGHLDLISSGFMVICI